MKDHPADVLIRLAYLEGVIRTRGAYETAVARRERAAEIAPGRRERLEEMLSAALPVPGDEDAAWSVGTWLRAARSRGGLSVCEIPVRLGVPMSVYRLMEQDRISPLDVDRDVWRRFRELFALTADALDRLIRGSHRLVVFRPDFEAALARYRSRPGGGARRSALDHAMREMYVRADLDLPSDEARRLEEFLRELR